jgi:hypothetical protein
MTAMVVKWRIRRSLIGKVGRCGSLIVTDASHTTEYTDGGNDDTQHVNKETGLNNLRIQFFLKNSNPKVLRLLSCFFGKQLVIFGIPSLCSAEHL